MEEDEVVCQFQGVLYVDYEIKELIRKISIFPTEAELNQLYLYLQDSSNIIRKNDARHLFVYYFIKSNSDRNVKKLFADRLTKSDAELIIFQQLIIDNCDEIVRTLKVADTFIASGSLLHCLHFISAYFQICHIDEHYDVIIKQCFPLHHKIFQVFAEQMIANFDSIHKQKNEEILSIVNTTFKQICTIFVKRPHPILSIYSIDFMRFSYAVLCHDHLGFDVRSKCGLIFAHSLNFIPEEEKINFVHTDFPILELLRDFEGDDWISLKSAKFKNILKNHSAKVVLYSALFNTSSFEKLADVKVNNKVLLEFLLGELLLCAKRSIEETAQIVEISRIVYWMTQSIESKPVSVFDNLFEDSLSFIYSVCDHSSDSVKKNIISFFNNITKAASLHFKTGERKYVQTLLKNVKLKDNKRRIDFLTVEYLCPHMGTEFLLQNLPLLRENLTSLLEDKRVGDQACSTYEILIREHYKEIEHNQWMQLWIHSIIIRLKSAVTPHLFRYQHIITIAFQLNPTILRLIFPDNYIGNQQEWGALLKCLKIARGSKMKYDFGTFDKNKFWWGLIEKEKLELFAVHRDEMIRVATLSVVVESQKSTEFFTEWEFKFLIDFYMFNIASQISSIRKQFISIYKKAFARYFAGLEVIKRQLMNIKKKAEGIKDPKMHEFLKNYNRLNQMYTNFLNQLVTLLISNLAVDGNYPRRSSALELLIFIQNYTDGEWKSWWLEDDIENLKNILYDSYESNKKMAVLLLGTFEPSFIGLQDSAKSYAYFSDALNLAYDVRPNMSLSAAYMLQVCSMSPVIFHSDKDKDFSNSEVVLNIIILLTAKLLSKIRSSSTDIYEAAQSSPLHGILLCIRHLVQHRNRSSWNEVYADTFANILRICKKIQNIVVPIVSSPAPEGYTPENEDLNLSDDSVKSQMILAYAWRNMKEMTLLLAEIIVQSIELQESHTILTESELIEIGTFFVNIFIQAKHRGVYEQAYVGFCMICQSFWKSKNENINCLPRKWLNEALALSTGKKMDDRLCSTRRSAGLPFLILSILSTEATYDRSLLNETMKQLLDVANNEEPINNEYRTHCMNILRVIFRHAKLNDLVATYVGRSVIIALKGIENDVWGVRNSSTLLYSTLITRMFGVQRTTDSEELSVKNKMTIGVYSIRFPELLKHLLDILIEDCEKMNSSVLHPVLLILARLYPSPTDTKLQIREYLPYINKCMAHTSYSTRQLAARASIAFVDPRNFKEFIINNFNKISDPSLTNNECHGILLQIWFVINSIEDRDQLPINELLEKSIHLLEMVGKRLSHISASVFMDIISLFVGNCSIHIELEPLKSILTSLSKVIEEQISPLTSRNNFEQSMMNLSMSILLNRLEHVTTTYHTINFDIANYLVHNNNGIMRTYCLYFLVYLNQSYNEFAYSEHPLFITEDLKVPEHIRETVNSFSYNTKQEFLTFIHKFIRRFLRSELKDLTQCSDECFTLVFLLVSYYPCVVSTMCDGNRKRALEMLLGYCDCDNEEIVSAVLTCIGVLFLQTDSDTLRTLDYNKLIDVLMESASPEAEEHRRLTVCAFLISVKFLFYDDEVDEQEKKILTGENLCNVLNIIMALFEDEDLRVRNAMSALTDDRNMVAIDPENKCGWKSTPERARLDFLKSCMNILPKDHVIAFWFAWANRHFPDRSKDISEIFERSELNLFAENIPIIGIAAKLLNGQLWALPYGFSYDDKSIFFEEQCLMVATILLNSINKYSFPIMDSHTKIPVICALKSIVSFLEQCGINQNFQKNFQIHFFEKIVEYLRKQVSKKDFYSLKATLSILFNPALTYDK